MLNMVPAKISPAGFIVNIVSIEVAVAVVMVVVSFVRQHFPFCLSNNNN